MKVPFEGGCACKLIRYVCTAEPLLMAHCHCRDCQYSSGTGHSSVLVVPLSEVSITGEPKYFESKAAAGKIVRRGFCPMCGTPMFSMNEAYNDIIGIKAATLDHPSEFQPVVDACPSDASHSAKQITEVLTPDHRVVQNQAPSAQTRILCRIEV